MSHFPGGSDKCDSRPVLATADEIFCFACVRNDGLRLPQVIDCHRTLGIDRFFLRFFPDLRPRLAEEVRRGGQRDGASQCDSYLDVINETPALMAHFSRSRFHGSSAQLVALGLLRMPVEFAHFASSETGELMHNKRPGSGECTMIESTPP